MSDTNEAMLEEWLADRPEAVKVAARAYPPWLLYRMPTGQLAQIESYDVAHADGTCTCTVSAWYEWSGPALAHGVFGVPFTDLTPEPLAVSAPEAP